MQENISIIKEMLSDIDSVIINFVSIYAVESVYLKNVIKKMIKFHEKGGVIDQYSEALDYFFYIESTVDDWGYLHQKYTKRLEKVIALKDDSEIIRLKDSLTKDYLDIARETKEILNNIKLLSKRVRLYQ